jgi:hypothetical protein
MLSFLRKHKYFILLIIIFCISECIVNPIGNFPLNDDWSYGKAVYFSLNGDFTMSGFGAMTLFTHLVWGMFFTKLFGFSFTVLRLSTLVSVVITMFVLNKLITDISKNKLLAFLCCLLLLYNPLYFNLSNTYMTDVNFNNLLIFCCYFAYSFFKNKSWLHFMLFFAFSLLLVLVRQYGIIVPFCFLFACFFLNEKKWLFLLYSAAGTVVVYFIFKQYENYLARVLSKDSAYLFSKDVHLTDKFFWIKFKSNLSWKYYFLLLNVLVYPAPLAGMYLWQMCREINKVIVFTTLLIASLFVFWILRDTKFPDGNVFINMGLGAETFYESLSGKSHIYSETFASITFWVKMIFSAVTLTTILLYVVALFNRRHERVIKIKPEIVFLLSSAIAYSAMIVLTESHFDRYYIPLITLILILMVYINRYYQINYQMALLPLAGFFYVSVFGTKDYLTWNRLRWKAYDYLVENKKANSFNVNGGFEVNCWGDLRANWWGNYIELKDYDYLIQFNKPEKDFIPYKEYVFQRYFPYRKDTMNIFVREIKVPENKTE